MFYAKKFHPDLKPKTLHEREFIIKDLHAASSIGKQVSEGDFTRRNLGLLPNTKNAVYRVPPLSSSC